MRLPYQDAAPVAQSNSQTKEKARETRRELCRSIFDSLALNLPPRRVTKRLGLTAWEALEALYEEAARQIEAARQKAYQDGARAALYRLRPV